jgi:hypothetical protein
VATIHASIVPVYLVVELISNPALGINLVFVNERCISSTGKRVIKKFSHVCKKKKKKKKKRKEKKRKEKILTCTYSVLSVE